MQKEKLQVTNSNGFLLNIRLSQCLIWYRRESYWQSWTRQDLHPARCKGCSVTACSRSTSQSCLNRAYRHLYWASGDLACTRGAVIQVDAPAKDSMAVNFWTIALRRARYAAPTALNETSIMKSIAVSWRGTHIVVVVTHGNPTGTWIGATWGWAEG